jgi:ketosteroid isomerase-like protein
MWTGPQYGSGKALSRLDDATIAAFVQSGVRASEQRDAQALCAQLTEDAQVKLIEVRLSGSHTQSFAKPEWCDYLRKGYADIPPGAQISTALNLQSVELAADGQSAEVSMVVTEQVHIAGQSLQMQSSQSGRITLVGGQARYTALSARVVGGQ